MNWQNKSSNRPLLWISVTLIVCVVIALVTIAGEYTVRYIYRDVNSTALGFSYFDSKSMYRFWGNKNFFGYRERDFQPAKPPGTFRVAVVGDSFTWGQGVDTSYRYTDLLECLLNENNAGDGVYYQVLNFGHPGWGYRHENEALEEHVAVSEADFVVVQWFINDIDDGYSEYFVKPQDNWWTWVDGLLTARSALYFVLKSRMSILKTMLPGQESYYEYLVRRYGDPSGEAWRRSQSQLVAMLRSLNSVSRGRSALLLFPHLVDESALTARLNEIMDRVKTVAVANHVAVVDLRATFNPAGGDMGRYWVNAFDAHPGPVAHARTAWQLIDELELGSITQPAPVVDPNAAQPVRRTHCRLSFAHAHRS